METKCSYCGKEIKRKPSEIKKSKNLYCSKDCLKKHKKILNLGENNPNKKYNFDQNFFKQIDTEFKAWFLGWIASDGSISNDGKITIAIDKMDLDVLKKIQKEFCSEIPIKHKKNTSLIYYTFCSKTIVQDLMNLLKLDRCKKANILSFPDIPENLNLHFLRGYFEGDGTIHKPTQTHRTPYCNIVSNSDKMLMDIKEKCECNSKINLNNHSISWSGVNGLDFLGKIYENCKFYMTRKHQGYLDWCLWKPSVKKVCVDNIYFCKTSSNAVAPFKSRVSDSGYDLTLIEKIKENGEVQFFDTGIKVTPPQGYYFDLVPRSSISKSGYVLANNIGIIDMSYTGNIIVPLIKIDKSKPDLELPCRLVQIIPRPIQHFKCVEVDELEDTERGVGGFGSTGSK